MGKRPKKLLDRVHETIRIKHYSIRTEEAYVSWIECYMLFYLLPLYHKVLRQDSERPINAVLAPGD